MPPSWVPASTAGLTIVAQTQTPANGRGSPPLERIDQRGERMSRLRFGVIGAGFWARFQLAAWQELEGAECVAVCDQIRGKADALARERGVPATYDDPEEMF